MDENIMNYQEAIVKIYIAALNSLRRMIGKEIFISMLKGKKDSKIVKGKYYTNDYYGIFASFKGNEVSNILNYLIEENLIKEKVKGKNTFIYANRRISELYKYYYNFIGYISDKSINLIEEEDKVIFNSLKELRYEIALEKGLAPYNICSDMILREICIQKPKTKEQIGEIYGIGERFIKNYSEKFLQLLKVKQENLGKFV